MASDSTLTNLILTLSSGSVTKMNFSAMGVSIAPNDFSTALASIIMGRISIDTSGTGMVVGAAAQYTASSNEMKFPKQNYGTNAKEKMDILHECAHAAADAQRTWMTFYYDWEVASYICGAMFHREATGSGPPSNWKDIFKKADAIGQKVTANPGLRVDFTEAWNLRQLIIADPAYASVPAHQLSGNDGT